MAKDPIYATTGFKYFISTHFILCQGPVDAFTRVRFGDKIAWQGAEYANTEITINKPELFGGDNREGGIVGNFDLIMGSQTEMVNPYLQFILPDGGYPIPAFRGLAQIIGKDFQHASNNPNLRPLSAEVIRIPSKGWYDAKALPGTADGVNPAHIIREMLLSHEWGLGYSEADLDDTSFRAAADTLFTEKFGLIFVWQAEATVHEFISTVINHIQGSLYIDPYTGLFTISLVRGGYSLTNLLTIDETVIISVESFERTGIDELVNQVTIVWHDYLLDQPQATTGHNAAIRELQGGVIATTMEFPGIPDAVLADKIVARELKKLSTPVAKMIFVANRKAAALKIGDVFLMTDPIHNLTAVPMRVGRLEYGNLESNVVRIHAVEDIFSFGETLYGAPPSTLWQDPISFPAPCPFRRITEVPYIQVERILNENQSSIDNIDPLVSFIAFQGTAPSGDAFSIKLHTRASGGTYKYKGGGRFCPTAVITNALAPELTSVLNLTGVQGLARVKLNTYAYVDNECVEVIAVTSTTVTVNRGILDTVPVHHPANTRIWFAENYEVMDKTQWATGVTVNVKALTVTGKGALDISAAPEDSFTVNRRWYRPYPPGNLMANGVRWPTATQAGPTVLTWNHRDREIQVSDYVKQDAGDFGPEAGTTYTIRVYRTNGTLARIVPGEIGTSWTYTAIMEAADNPGASVRFDIVADRGGVESWQANSVTVYR